MQSWELIAHGRVQGVGYRWHVLRCANQYGVKGYVRNQSDGTVLILAQGDEAAIEGFVNCAKFGSSTAVVSSMDALKMDHSKRYNDFEIR